MMEGLISPMRINRRRIAPLALCCILLQTALQAAPEAVSVAKGTWGGEHVLLEVSEKGADLEFDCAHGQITQPLTIGKLGNFDAAGTFTPEHGGPVRRDEVTPTEPARYSGKVDGDTMSFTVTVGKETLGTFNLSRDAQPKLTKCR